MGGGVHSLGPAIEIRTVFLDKVVTHFPEVSHLLPPAYLVVDVVR